MKRKSPWKMYLLLVLFIAILAFLGYLGLANIPSITEQLKPGSTSLQVQINHPQNQTGWPMNFPIPIQVSAWGTQPAANIELYINGRLYDTKNLQENPQNKMVINWQWQPGSEGVFVLVARAVGENGESGNSNPVIIEAGPAVGTGSPYLVTEGQTLETIANDKNLSHQELQDANLDLHPGEALVPGSEILIPNPPDPTNNTTIPGFNPLGDSVSYSDPNAPDNGSSGNIPKWTIFNDLSFLIKASIKGNQSNANDTGENNPQAPEASGDTSKLPPAPKLFGNFVGCDVKLNAEPIFSETEDGYFIYRSRDGDAFERITTLPAFKNAATYETLNYVDTNQYGLVTYYAASFNTYGENPGPPITFPLDQTNCSSDNGGGNQTNHIEKNGDLSLVTNLDTAYLYIQINDNQAERVPEGNRMFLANSGIKFNLYDYLDNRDDLMELTDLNLHMELWGWQGDTLTFVGVLDQQIHRSVLLVCSGEGEGTCTGGGPGKWTQEMTILPNIYKPLNEQKYELRWLSSSLSTTDKICLSAAEQFTGSGMLDANPVILNICYYNTQESGAVQGNEGTYLLDFGRILYPQGNPAYPPYNGHAEDFQYPDFELDHPMGSPFNLAVRVLPVMDESGFNDQSNTIHMHHLSPFEQTNLPPLASDIPSLYDIEILEETYKPPQYEIYNKWGCVIVDYDPSGKYSAGQEVCPLNYVECGVNVDCEDPGFWGMLGMGWDLVANLFKDAKETIAGTIADTIPYCDQSSLCQDAVQAGVDYGVTALTGLPPNLPNADELVSQGMTEVIVGELAGISDPDLISYVCGDSCKAEIANQIKPYIAYSKSYYSQPGCFSPGEHYGEFPVCFAPPARVHSVQGSYNFPGYIVVRVTRKTTPESLQASDEIKNKIQLYLTVDGENHNRIGQFGKYCSYQDNITLNQLPDPSRPINSLANWGYYAFGDEPMQGPLNKSAQVTIPWIEPGQSIDIPIRLEVLHNIADEYCITTAMNQYLFFKGTSHMTATEYCYSSESSQVWVPCSQGGSDFWDYNNPPAPGTTAEDVIYGQIVAPEEGD